MRLPAPPRLATPFGVLLRRWRGARRLSQLALAAEAGISARHLSFVETGRAAPSREVVARLAETLQIPLRERNALSLAAGFAPVHQETPLAAPPMAQVRRAIDLILRHQNPYPAFILDRHWNLLGANESSGRIFGLLRAGRTRHVNVMHSIFDPASLRPTVVNWTEVAYDLIGHLHRDLLAAPWDDRTRRLLDEVLAYPGVPRRWAIPEPGAPAAPLLAAVYRHGGRKLRFFSTITTFGTPHDVTLAELRIESSFPADETTDRFCRELAAGR